MNEEIHDKAEVQPGTSSRTLLGVVLYRKRKRHGITLQQLSEMTHLDKGTLSRIERGENRNPQSNTLELLGNALNLSPSVLKELSQHPAEQPSPEIFKVVEESKPSELEELYAIISQLKQKLESMTVPKEIVAATSQLANIFSLYAQTLEKSGQNDAAILARTEHDRFLQQALQTAERYHGTTPGIYLESQISEMKQKLLKRLVPAEQLAVLSQLANILSLYAEHQEKAGQNAVEARKESAMYLRQALEEAEHIRQTLEPVSS